MKPDNFLSRCATSSFIGRAIFFESPIIVLKELIIVLHSTIHHGRYKSMPSDLPKTARVYEIYSLVVFPRNILCISDFLYGRNIRNINIFPFKLLGLLSR
jgi:hypothetical protein